MNREQHRLVRVILSAILFIIVILNTIFMLAQYKRLRHTESVLQQILLTVSEPTQFETEVVIE